MFAVALMTCPIDQAERMAKVLVEKRVAACVNIVSNVSSLYWWNHRIESVRESLLVVKTRKRLFRRLIEETRRIHPYKIPEVILLDITKGYKPYLEWIRHETRSTSK